MRLCCFFLVSFALLNPDIVQGCRSMPKMKQEGIIQHPLPRSQLTPKHQIKEHSLVLWHFC